MGILVALAVLVILAVFPFPQQGEGGLLDILELAVAAGIIFLGAAVLRLVAAGEGEADGANL
jgi:hypothetical protein